MSSHVQFRKEVFGMGKILSINFWVQTFISTFITMVMIYIIKQIANKTNMPVVSDVANAI